MTDHKNSQEMKHDCRPNPNPVSNPKNPENIEEAKHDQTQTVLKKVDVLQLDQETLDIIKREG